MAESSTRMLSSGLQSVMDDINRHSSDISDEERHELRQNMQELIDIDASGRLQRGLSEANGTENNNDDSRAVANTKSLIKFTGQGLFEVAKLVSGPAKITLSVIAAVVVHVFSKDVVKEVAEKFRAVLDERFMTRCHATSHKFKNCVRYLNGLPRPDDLSNDERKMYIDRLASDNPINTGLKEISVLAVDIQKLIDATEVPEMTVLMNKVQMYCCLTTFRELFLLARFTIESAYGINTQSIINVIEGQRQDDQRLLRFLYRPSKNTLGIFLKYTPNKWPIVVEFLHRRRLVMNANGFDNRVCQIFSVAHPDRLLSFHDLVLLTVVRCDVGTEGNHTLFRLRVRHGDIVTLHPFTRPGYYVYNQDWVRIHSDPAQGSREWQIVEIEPETPNEYPYYFFRLSSQGNNCMYVDFTGRVYVGKYAKGHSKCFWRLTAQGDGTTDGRNASEILYSRSATD